MRPITIGGRELRFPAVCAPLVARTPHLLGHECAAVAAKRPDMIEWRVDHFDALNDTRAVLAAAAQIKAHAANIPILFTRRHSREGGAMIAVGEGEVMDVYRAVCASGQVDAVDFEMENDPAHLERVREMTKAASLPLVLSFHDFRSTPTVDALVQRFHRAEALGADIAKVAVMPQSQQDVLNLLQATSQASREVGIPVVSMAMGKLGAVTRAIGWLFGSAMTFAIGQERSAPGQMAIEDMQAVISALQRVG